MRTKNRMNRAQTSPEPGTLLDARVNTVFSPSPILCDTEAFQLVVSGRIREKTHQDVDVSYPKRAKGNFGIEVTSEPPFGSFSYRTLIQSRESEHI